MNTVLEASNSTRRGDLGECSASPAGGGSVSEDLGGRIQTDAHTWVSIPAKKYSAELQQAKYGGSLLKILANKSFIQLSNINISNRLWTSII